MTDQFSGNEDRAFQAVLDSMHLGNDHTKISDARCIWNAARHFGATVPVGGMGKTSILRDVNVRSSASTSATVTSPGNLSDREKFEGVFPLDGPIHFNDLWKVYVASEKTVEAHSFAMQQNARRDGWNARGALTAGEANRLGAAEPTQGLFKVVHGPLGSDGLTESVRLESLGDWDIENLPAGMILSADGRQQAEYEDSRWKSLHGAMQQQRDHHRNVSNGLRQQVEVLSALLRESVGMVRGVVGCCDDELGDRIDAALLAGVRALKSSDALAFKMIGVKLPSMATEPVGEVKRYEFDRFGDKHQDEFGPYVLASDFDALAAQVITQGEVAPAEAILYQGEPGKLAVRLPHEPAPTGLGWNFHRKWELRRSAYSFDALIASLGDQEKLLESADSLIRRWMSNDTTDSPIYEASEEFLQAYRMSKLPTEGV